MIFQVSVFISWDHSSNMNMYKTPHVFPFSYLFIHALFSLVSLVSLSLQLDLTYFRSVRTNSTKSLNWKSKIKLEPMFFQCSKKYFIIKKNQKKYNFHLIVLLSSPNYYINDTLILSFLIEVKEYFMNEVFCLKNYFRFTYACIYA